VGALNNGDRTGTGWGSGGGWNDATSSVFPDWVQITLAGNKTLSEVDVVTLQDNYPNPVNPDESLTFSLYGITSFDVQYWNGSAWATVPGGNIAGNTNVLRKITFSPISTDKIRVVVNGSLAGYSRIVEIEAWGDPAQTVVNHALAGNGGVASASSVHSAGYPVEAINNGDRTGIGWASGGGWNDATRSVYPDWVQINLNGTKTLSQIDVVTLQDNYLSPVGPNENLTFSLYGITAYDVQYWNGGDWTTVLGGSVSGNNKVLRRFQFSPIATSAVRLLIHNSIGGWSRVIELEAWGAP
jgi:hypothetical protein